jgi:hypothetical protein
MIMKIEVLKYLAISFLLVGCTGKVKEVPADKFIGLWELKGRSMFDGMQIRIERQSDKFTGRIVRLNENKLVQMFADTSDIWVSEISRSSNFQFRLTERKIARDLFALYGLSTSQEFRTEFIDDNTIGLGTDNSDPQSASITYKRVQ